MAANQYDLNTIIKLNYSEFTKAEIKVADYVLQHPNDILHLSITELADVCGVGDTTVFRLCKDIGLNGYQEFKVLLAQTLATTSNNTSALSSGTVQPTDSIEEICQKTLSSALYTLNCTYELINYEAVEKAVSMIEDANTIRFFGSGSSGIIAMDAKSKFIRIIPNVECAIDGHIQAISVALMSPKDLAIVYSYGGSNKDIIDVMRIAKERGASTIAITRFTKSPITIYADVVLLCGSNEGPLQGGSISARISQIFWTEILYNEYFRRNYETCIANKEITTKAISNKLL